MAATTTTGSWRVRREGGEGKGREVDFARLAQQIADGLWSEADEVRGPRDARWLPIGDHPLLEEFLPPRPPFQPAALEEVEMDMTPMIDVTFQLIIFFMITATFVLQKTLDMPQMADDQEKTARRQSIEELRRHNIIVNVKAGGEVTVNEQQVALANLEEAIEKAMEDRDDVEMVLDVDDSVEHQTVVRVLDAAGGAEIEKVHWARRAPPGA